MGDRLTTMQDPPAERADLDQARQWLTTLHGGAPGLINIVATDEWAGRNFASDNAGINAAVAYIATLDRQRKQGIYARVTTLSQAPAPGKRGSATDSLAFPGFWADLDLHGPGHKTKEKLPATIAEAKQIITASGLPEPTLWIHSGGGLYPWHLLHEPTLVTADNRDDMATLAARWQLVILAASEQLGYGYGEGVGDLARVLRIPGTINRKAGLARACTILESSGATYALDELATILYSIDLPEPTQAARTTPPPRPQATIHTTTGQAGPFDALAEICEWRDLWEPAGWTFITVERDGAELWLRPGGTSKYSVRCGYHGVPVAVVHSEEAGLPSGGGQRLTHGRVLAHLLYGGNETAAAKDLRAAAAGDPAAGAARALRPAILDHIRHRCGVRPWTAAPAINGSHPADYPPHPADTAEEPQESEDDEGEGWTKGPVRRRGRLPEDFWNARPVFAHIRQAAHARARSGDIVLGGLLARLSSLVPPDLRADTGVGSPASLNMFSNLLGPSGSGKSSAAWIPRRLLAPPPDIDFLDELPLGSGEGIAEAYMGEKSVDTDEIYRAGPKKGLRKTELIRAQVRHNALFYADEGESLTKQLFGRNGATIGESLRRAWTGGTIGQYNGHKVNTRVIQSGTYSLGLVIGFQPETALPLLEDAAAGSPQRFLWFSSTDPSIPDDIVDDPGPLNLSLIRYGFGENPSMSFAATLMQQIRDDDKARSRGEMQLPPLDSHKPLMLVKVASLFAILDNRLDVTVEDWQLAHVVWDTSCELRDWLAEYGARQLAEAAERQTRAHVEREVRAHAAKAAADHDVERVARRVAKRVHEAKGMTRGALNKAIAYRDRNYVTAAIDLAESRDWVTAEGDEIAPGDSMPS